MSDERSARRPYGTGSLFPQGGSWFGQWRVGGRLVKRRLGKRRTARDRDGLTRPQAERALAKAINELRSVPEATAPQTFGTIGDAYLASLEGVRDLKPTTLADYRSILRHWDHHFGTRSVRRLTPEDFIVYMRTKSTAGLAAKTIRNHVVFARACLAFAVKRGWLQSNPIDVVERPRVSNRSSDIRYLASEEVKKLLDAVPGDRLGPTDHALYVSGLMTGLRQGELLALRWRDVDFAAGAVRVRRSVTRGRFGPPKSRRANRAVPIAALLRAELTKHLRRTHYSGEEDLVFCNPDTGRAYDASKQRKRFKQAVARAGLRAIRFHDLRHTFGTRMAAVGVPIRTIQEWMGHESAETTEIYADYSPNPEGERTWTDQAFEGLGDLDDAA